MAKLSKIAVAGTSIAAAGLALAGWGASAASADSAGKPAAAKSNVVRPMTFGSGTTVYADTWLHATPHVYTNPDHVATASAGDDVALICYTYSDSWTDSHGTSTKWDLVIDRTRNNAAGYLNDIDVQGATSQPCA